MKISKSNSFFLLFFFIHIFKLGWLVALPNLFFYFSSLLNKALNYKPMIIIFLFIIYSVILFLVNITNISTAALLDLKPIIMLGILPYFFVLSKHIKIDLKDFSKFIILVIYSYILIQLLLFQEIEGKVLIRGDVGILALVSLIFFIPFNMTELKNNFIWLLLIMLLFVIYQGRASILVATVVLIYFVVFAIRNKMISKRIFPIFVLFPLFVALIMLQLMYARASDISASWDVGVLESEARIMALYVFYEVLQQMSTMQYLFGSGFGVDYSENVECYFRFMCLHMQNISIGNADTYPAVGFHNELIRIFLTTGFFGVALFLFFLSSLWKNVRPNQPLESLKNHLYLRSMIIIILTSMFSHGIIGTTITGFTLLFVIAVLYRKFIQIQYVQLK